MKACLTSLRTLTAIGSILTLLTLGFRSDTVLAQSGLFDRDAKRVSFILGRGSSFGNDYTVLGLGAGYYVIDGLELGLNIQAWLGDKPSIYQITPEARYTFQLTDVLAPYAGVLYRETLIENRDNTSAYGAKAGLSIITGRNSYIGAGIVTIKYNDCRESELVSCSETYPELAFLFSF